MFTNSSLTRCAAGALLAAVSLAGAARAAADEHLTGNITVVTDNGFAMQLRSGESMLVTVNDETKIRQTNDDSHMAKADLIPGLEVDVDGTMDGNGRLVAQHVRFSKEDLQHAREVKAALTPGEQLAAKHGADLQQHAVALDQHGTTLGEHAGTLGRQGSELADHETRIVATSGAVEAANNRITNLDEFNVIDTLTIYFRHGDARISKASRAELTAMAAKARTVPGYKLQVAGYASAVGGAEYNTTLSHLRAEAVIAALQQNGAIPAGNIFIPAAMGTTDQVAPNKTAKGQAQNRRVVVTLLQNKGIAAK